VRSGERGVIRPHRSRDGRPQERPAAARNALRAAVFGMTESHAPSRFVPRLEGRVVGVSISVVRGQPWLSVSNADRWFGLPARSRSGCG
jgi:hypothetical protein